MTKKGLLIWKSNIFQKYYCATLKNNTNLVIRKKHYDIAIAGGGLVGNAMACAVAKNIKLSEKKIILFECSPHKKIEGITEKDDYSNRVVSLNPSSRKFLESLGAWNFISEKRYKLVKKLQIWDGCSDSLITFNDDLVNDVSYIVENDLILYSLEKVSSQLENITIEYESKIKNIKLPIDHEPVKLEMENGNEYTCSLLVGADGCNSQTRKALGCQYLTWNYNQKGIVATLKLSEPMENIVAWQRFLPTGPVALLPLTDDMSSLVWSTGTKEADELLNLSDELFVDAVNDAFWKTHPKNEIINSTTNGLNKVLEYFTLNSNSVRQLPPSISAVIPKSRAAFPLGFGHSTKYAKSGIVLIGDAAHRIHPLAGQGLNLGLGDVAFLTTKLAESVYDGSKLGSASILKLYESERQKQILPMLLTVDGIQKLYSTSFTPVVLLRSIGLQITNALGPVKKKIIEQAS